MQHSGVMTRRGMLASMTHGCQNLILHDLSLQCSVSENRNMYRGTPADATGVFPEATACGQEPREPEDQDGRGEHKRMDGVLSMP